LTNLSDGGTSLQLPNQVPPACKVYFEFALPNQKQLVRLSGEIAWRDSKGRSGIRFLNVPQSSRRLIQAWLEHIEAHSTNDSAKAAPSSDSSETEAFEMPAPETPAPRSEKKLVPKNATLVSNAGNRRGEQRFACKVGAEVYSAGASFPNRCTLSDISEGGCYVEMPSPLGGKSGVEILIRTNNTKFKIKGEVLTVHPGFGMGVRFVFRNSAEREEVMRLLAVVTAGPSLDELPR
jgi:hypothetical protein